ncbi:MAG: GNAT family N-acetyltransferase [Candidatus Limnocylindrales bacterium]
MVSLARSRGRTDSLAVRFSTDRELLRSFLEQDRLFAAYALCDLDDREFSRTRWGVAYGGPAPRSVVLEYAGLAPQPMFAMGEQDGVEAVLRNLIRPRVAYLAMRPELLPAVDSVYHVDPGPEMVRMAVNRETFRPSLGLAARLVPGEIGDLNRLYELGFTAWLPATAITEGVYYGVRVRGRLVAAAGTHVISREARMAVVGNVLTHRDFRGRGFAKITTSAVTAELLRSCDDVVLNVRADNAPALAAYRALGYREHCRFDERLVHRRSSSLDGMMAPIRRLFAARREP